MINFNDLSQEEQAAWNRRRQRGYRYLRASSIIQLTSCFLCFIAGVISVILASKTPLFPYITAVSLWASILVIISALLGLAATRLGLHTDQIATRVRLYATLNFVFNILGMVVSMVAVVFGVIGFSYCTSSKSKLYAKCQPEDSLMAVSGLFVATGLLLLLVCLLSTFYFCCYGRTLGFKSQHEIEMDIRHASAGR